MPNKSMTWGAVATSLDISRLNDLGICVSQENEILYNEQFDYYIIKFYANYGTGQVSVDTSNFYITKGYPLDVTTNQHGYLSQNQSGVNIQRGMSGPLVTYGGEYILYNPDATYTISTIDNTSHQSIDTTYFSIVEYSGNVGLHLSENSPVQVYNNVQRVDFSVTTQSRVGDEVTINADLPYTTSVTSYKLRLSDRYPDAVWLYFTPDKSDELIFEDTLVPLYKSDGTLATRTDYGDYELEALEPIPPYANNDSYGRFSNAIFSYATYNSISDVLHVSFSNLYQGSEDGACITNRLRVIISTPPAPALPTVSMVISYIRQDKSRYYTAGGTYYLYDDSGNSIPWDSVNKYQFFGTYESDSSTTIDSGEFYQRYQSIIESSGVVNYKNTGLGLYVQRVVFYSCASSSATIITVYDSSNNPYNAFKYTSEGTDYYYVLDGTQADWTDDLSGIGYKLPTIGYVSSLKTEISMNAGDLQTLYDENGTKMTVSTYDISYPAVRVYSSSSDTTGTAVVNNNWTVHGPQFSNGDLSVSNLTGSTQTIQRIAFIK